MQTGQPLEQCVRVFGKVRMYDPSSSVRRPVLSVSYGDCPTTTLCIQPNASQYVPNRFSALHYKCFLCSYIGIFDDHDGCEWVNVSSGTGSPRLSRTKSKEP